MARILKKKTTKKINVKLQQLRESEFHTTLGEDKEEDIIVNEEQETVLILE